VLRVTLTPGLAGAPPPQLYAASVTVALQLGRLQRLMHRYPLTSSSAIFCASLSCYTCLLGLYLLISAALRGAAEEAAAGAAVERLVVGAAPQQAPLEPSAGGGAEGSEGSLTDEGEAGEAQEEEEEEEAAEQAVEGNGGGSRAPPGLRLRTAPRAAGSEAGS